MDLNKFLELEGVRKQIEPKLNMKDNLPVSVAVLLSATKQMDYCIDCLNINQKSISC